METAQIDDYFFWSKIKSWRLQKAFPSLLQLLTTSLNSDLNAKISHQFFSTLKIVSNFIMSFDPRLRAKKKDISFDLSILFVVAVFARNAKICIHLFHHIRNANNFK